MSFGIAREMSDCRPDVPSNGSCGATRWHDQAFSAPCSAASFARSTEAREVGSFEVSKVDISFLPLPKVSLLVTPKAAGRRPRTATAAAMRSSVYGYRGFLRIRLAIYLVIIALIAACVAGARPPSRATIEVGPLGGSFHQTACSTSGCWPSAASRWRFRSKANTLEILPDLADPDPGSTSASRRRMRLTLPADTSTAWATSRSSRCSCSPVPTSGGGSA